MDGKGGERRKKRVSEAPIPIFNQFVFRGGEEPGRASSP